MTKSSEPQSSNSSEPVSAASLSDESSNLEPTLNSATTQDTPEFGWSAYAERLNGRFAMIGFVAILMIEAISGNTFLNWAGLLN